MISCRKGRFRRVRVGGIGFTPPKKHRRGPEKNKGTLAGVQVKFRAVFQGLVLRV